MHGVNDCGEGKISRGDTGGARIILPLAHCCEMEPHAEGRGDDEVSGEDCGIGGGCNILVVQVGGH